MEHRNNIPKHPSMVLAETLVTINGHFIQAANVEEEKDEVVVVNMTEVYKYDEVLQNTYKQSDFFAALEEIKKIKNVVEELTENLAEMVKDANSRICERCEGSGVENAGSNNPYASDCSLCGGSGFSS